MKHRLFALCALLSIGVSACGGGTASPFVAAANGTTLSPSAPATISVPAVSNIATTVTATGTGSVNVSQSVAEPAALAPLAAASVQTAKAPVRTQASAANTPVLFIAVQAVTASTLVTWPGLNITLPATPSGSYYEAEWTGTGWVNVPGSGAASINGDTLSFPALPANPAVQIPAGGTLYIAVYNGVPLAAPSPSPSPSAPPSASPSPSPTSSPTASPTSSPTASPTASPTSSPTASPTSSPTSSPTASPTPSPSPSPSASPTPAPLSASATTLALTQTGASSFTVTEAGYRGSYTVTSSNTSVVTVSTPVVSSSNTTTIAINAVAAGTANVTVKDGNNQSVVVSVGVTTTPVTIQAHKSKSPTHGGIR